MCHHQAGFTHPGVAGPVRAWLGAGAPPVLSPALLLPPSHKPLRSRHIRFHLNYRRCPAHVRRDRCDFAGGHSSPPSWDGAGDRGTSPESPGELPTPGCSAGVSLGQGDQVKARSGCAGQGRSPVGENWGLGISLCPEGTAALRRRSGPSTPRAGAVSPGQGSTGASGGASGALGTPRRGEGAKAPIPGDAPGPRQGATVVPAG